jgi:AcrR family transcriptional regulator
VVAEKAGVGRATLYRRWPSTSALIRESIRTFVTEQIPIPDTGSFAGDLKQVMQEISQYISGPIGRAALAAGLTGDPHQGEPRHPPVWDSHWISIQPVFQRAVQRGEFPAEADAEAFISTVVGALYFRSLVMMRPIDTAWIDRVLKSAL